MVYCRRRDRGRQLWLLLLLLAGGGYLCLVLRSNGGASSAGVGGTELWHRRGEAPAGSRPGFYHGAIGLQADNTPAWQPQNYVRATSEDTQAELKEHGFHLRLSDSLPLDRDVPDGRDRMCSQVDFGDLDELPDTSVVFVFYNEALSTLLRSIHSVLNHSPPRLLREIILVDDGSDKPHLGAELERQIQFLPKVKLVRQPQRSGLVQARLLGARTAVAETFTVLDSHIEVQPGWLEPLMHRLKGHPTRVVMPQIDSIKPETFQPVNMGIGCSLGFLWSLTEHSIPIQRKDQALRSSEIDAVRSPTMAGGLFTVNREFFWRLGGYDTDFGFWGTENLEFSFRIWQCGGTLECMPCSRVYHIFRGHHPYSLPSNSIARNKLRTAAIWMDEYAFLVKASLGSQASLEVGAIEHMLQLRRDLECKPFRWFMTEVYPENIFSNLDEVEAVGDIKNTKTGQCLDTLWHSHPGEQFGLYGCHGQGGSQAFVLTHKLGQIRPLSDLDLCLASDLTLRSCRHTSVITWKHTDDEWLMQPGSGMCLSISMQRGLALQMTQCTSNDQELLRWQVSRRQQPLLQAAQAV